MMARLSDVHVRDVSFLEQVKTVSDGFGPFSFPNSSPNPSKPGLENVWADLVARTYWA
jgi:hypothetical protein